MQSFGTVRALDEEGMRVQAVISTGNIARDDAIIDPVGWDFTNYRRNPVVLFNHNDFSAMPVARTVDGPNPAGAELVATAEFDAEDPEAVRLFGKIRRGFINATSVRWLPKRWEFVKVPGEGASGERTVLVFREQELLEWSFVNIPADPGAVILRSDGGAIDLSTYVLPAPEEPEGARDLAALDALMGRIEAVLSKRAKTLDVDALVVQSLVKVTGRSEERVRQEMAAGGYR